MVKLIYIDEQQDQRSSMVRAALLSEQFDNDDIEALDPCLTIEEMIEEIDSHHPDVIITDFRLSEYKAGVTYNGVELVRKYLGLRKDFPCFVTTGFARDAANAAAIEVDINTIFSKDETRKDAGDDRGNPLPFFVRVKLKTEAHQKLIASYEEELLGLREKLGNGALAPDEAERLLLLDGELEAMLGGSDRVPDSVKRIALQPLTDIVGEATLLLQELEKLHPQAGVPNA